MDRKASARDSKVFLTGELGLIDTFDADGFGVVLVANGLEAVIGVFVVVSPGVAGAVVGVVVVAVGIVGIGGAGVVGMGVEGTVGAALLLPPLGLLVCGCMVYPPQQW